METAQDAKKVLGPPWVEEAKRAARSWLVEDGKEIPPTIIIRNGKHGTDGFDLDRMKLGKDDWGPIVRFMLEKMPEVDSFLFASSMWFSKRDRDDPKVQRELETLETDLMPRNLNLLLWRMGKHHKGLDPLPEGK